MDRNIGVSKGIQYALESEILLTLFHSDRIDLDTFCSIVGKSVPSNPNQLEFKEASTKLGENAWFMH